LFQKTLQLLVLIYSTLSSPIYNISANTNTGRKSTLFLEKYCYMQRTSSRKPDFSG